MEKETIIERARKLPLKTSKGVPKYEEAWVLHEAGLVFTLMKEELSEPKPPRSFTLFISGETKKVMKTIKDFTDMFGQPAYEKLNPNSTSSFIWNADEVDVRLAKKSRSR